MSEIKEAQEVQNKMLTAQEMLALMAENAFSLEDQAEKEASEASGSFTKIERIRPKAGTTSVRVLPLLPGQDRKGYEYPLKQLFLKILIPDGKGGWKKDKNGKNLSQSFPVINARQVFKDLKEDLIDKYRFMAVAELKSRNVSEDVIKVIDGNGFGGGLKFDSKRIAYCLDPTEKEPNKIKMLELSYSQYKDVEAAKMLTWGKLVEYDKEDGGNGHVFCPLTSVQNGRLLDMTGKEENKKLSYTFAISDADRAVKKVTEEQISALMAMPSIPSEIYRYSRFHFTATLEFLKQYDNIYSIGVFNTDSFQEAVKELESMLSPEDTKVFEFKADAGNGGDAEEAELTIDSVEAAYIKFDESGEDEKSENGAELRAMMKELIEQEDLGISVLRKHTLADIWEMILEKVDGPQPSNKEEKEEEEEEKPAVSRNEEPEEEDRSSSYDDDENDDEPATYQPSPTTGSRTTRRPGVRRS